MTIIQNIYRPRLMRIDEIIDETPDVRTLRLSFLEEEDRKSFGFRTGQFGIYACFGAGESTFCIASPHTRTDFLECCFRKVGRVTEALRRLDEGDTLGFRGPYGNYFPIEDWEGKNLLFIAGGIALPPLRSVIWTALDMRERFKNITILYGARTFDDLVYKRELKEWEERDDISLITTIDPGGEPEDWAGKVGFVPTVLEESAPDAEDTIALVCGPPIMIKFTLPVLIKLNFRLENVFTTLENKMKCGLGKCGRCNVGSYYVCKDGPVFTAAQLKELPPEY